VKAVRFPGNRHCEIITVPDPAPGAGEVIIEMRAAGLCGSDLEWYRGDTSGSGAYPVVPGHEPCGIVAAVGPGVSGWGVGDRVVVNHHYGCGACLPCREGSPKYCRRDHGTYGFTDDGADAQYMAARASALIALPDSLSYEDGAAISCGAGTAYAALCRLGISGRDTLVIVGQGPVGLSATMLATAMGAQVIACEMSGERLRLAASTGAAHVIDASAVDPLDAIAAITAGRGADAALDCSGSPPGRVAAIGATRPRGQVCFVGVGPPTTFDVSEEIIGRELTVYGSWTFTAAGLIRCMNFVTRHSCQLSRLISQRSAIEDAAAAFALFDAGSTGKCMLVF